MTRELPRRLAVATAAAALVPLAGCSSRTSTADPAPASSGSSAIASSSLTTPTPSPRPKATPTPGVPTPGSMERPATRSGSLSKTSFPTPRRLGAGWRYSVDPGSAEDGYSGNGTPALARDPQEVVQTAVPFGCARPRAMPTPTHALEVDYTLHGAKVIAIRGTFADRSSAAAFFTARSANLRACAGHSGSAAIGPLVAAVTTPAPDAIASDRTPTSDPWREVSLLDGTGVVLVAVQGRHPLTPDATARVVRLFRS